MFLVNWAICYCLIMFAMFTDNLFWIPADYKWFGTNEWRKYFKVYLTIKNREYVYPVTKEGWRIVKSRIIAVLTHQYDIIPAIITSFILALITTFL